MSREQLEQFQQLILADAALQRQLVGVVDRDSFIRLAVELGATHGYHFTVAEVEQAMRAGRRAWFEHKAVR